MPSSGSWRRARSEESIQEEAGCHCGGIWKEDSGVIHWMVTGSDIFKYWDFLIAMRDFKQYQCKKCGKQVQKFSQWVRGETLCMDCFNDAGERKN